jgi:hypothetical protein
MLYMIHLMIVTFRASNRPMPLNSTYYAGEALLLNAPFILSKAVHYVAN